MTMTLRVRIWSIWSNKTWNSELIEQEVSLLSNRKSFPSTFPVSKKPCIAVAQVKYQEPHIQLDVVSCSRVNV